MATQATITLNKAKTPTDELITKQALQLLADNLTPTNLAALADKSKGMGINLKLDVFRKTKDWDKL